MKKHTITKMTLGNNRKLQPEVRKLQPKPLEGDFFGVE